MSEHTADWHLGRASAYADEAGVQASTARVMRRLSCHTAAAARQVQANRLRDLASRELLAAAAVLGVKGSAAA